jgi:murein DD-endopeptidase MepM/ murein hydrolase activator NlpD
MILATLFFVSVALIILSPLILLNRNRKAILLFYGLWFGAYAIFILFFTGPKDISVYPPATNSPYKLPWAGGVKRFVAQGNRSFTTHRGLHEGAWDFVMSNGTEVLAAREGHVVKVEDQWDGIGLKSNVIMIEHADGTRAGYAHVRHRAALVKVGDFVKQGQVLTLSGMVGQTVFPHLHFFVIDKEGASPVPISFSDVEDGVPLAGHFYISGNN